MASSLLRWSRSQTRRAPARPRASLSPTRSGCGRRRSTLLRGAPTSRRACARAGKFSLFLLRYVLFGNDHKRHKTSSETPKKKKLVCTNGLVRINSRFSLVAQRGSSHAPCITPTTTDLELRYFLDLCLQLKRSSHVYKLHQIVEGFIVVSLRLFEQKCASNLEFFNFEFLHHNQNAII